jgi:hypothetical protein
LYLVDSKEPELIIGGKMRTIGLISSAAVLFFVFTGVQAESAKIFDADWVPIGGIPAGTDGEVEALIFDRSGNLYAGGNFRIAGGDSANYIAKWDGNLWTALGSGMNGVVVALAFDSVSRDLYAGGDFTSAGGVPANHIAKWNGSTWSPLGTGTDSAVYALAFDKSGNLFAGGSFTNAGDSSANKIAKWNGSTWSPLGSGMSGSICSRRTIVYALAFDSSGNLYAGGYFTTAGGVAANFIAKWNGNAWSPLGSGMGGFLCDDYVFALTFDTSGILYAGGSFTTAGGAPANNIAKWNGSAWSAVGSGMDNTVKLLCSINRETFTQEELLLPQAAHRRITWPSGTVLLGAPSAAA